jgi:hypothetical protein
MLFCKNFLEFLILFDFFNFSTLNILLSDCFSREIRECFNAISVDPDCRVVCFCFIKFDLFVLCTILFLCYSFFGSENN